MTFNPYQIDLGLRLGNTEGKVIANLGAGRSDSPISEQFLKLECARLVNVEAWGPSYDVLAKLRFAAHVVENHRADIGVWLGKSEDASVDIIVLLDVLEHFENTETRAAELLLGECLRVAREKVVIWLPFGECPQADLEGNPLQKHRSTWVPDDLLLYGFQVEVFKGFHGHMNPPCDAGWAVWDASTVVGTE